MKWSGRVVSKELVDLPVGEAHDILQKRMANAKKGIIRQGPL